MAARRGASGLAPGTRQFFVDTLVDDGKATKAPYTPEAPGYLRVGFALYAISRDVAVKMVRESIRKQGRVVKRVIHARLTDEMHKEFVRGG